MKEVKSHELLTQLEQQVESHLNLAIKTFQNLSEEKLLQPSINGGWSIAQCLEHLNLYGNYYLPEIQKGLKKNFEDKSGDFKSTWLGNYFTRMMNPDTGKARIKAFKNYSPPQKLDPYIVVADFIRQQENLLGYLRLARSKDLNKIKVAISIARIIKLKLGDTFRFLIAHDERHIRQAKKNLAVI